MECVTHHYACECREEHFKKLREILDNMSVIVEPHEMLGQESAKMAMEQYREICEVEV